MTDQENAKLREVLRTIVPKILRGRERRMNEEATKTSLIEPVLAALGWDVQDWDQVQKEYRAKPGDNPVDYALSTLGKPRLVIEAKGLGEDLSIRKWISQVLAYATTTGVGWCVLTNGDEYRFYNLTARVDAEEKELCRVFLSGAKEDDAVNALAPLSRSNLNGPLLDERWAVQFVDRRVKQALLDMLKSRDKGLVSLIRRKVRDLKPKQITESLGRLDGRIDSPTMRPAVSPTPSSPEPRREAPIIDVEALRQRQQAGEPIAKLAREVGVSWQRLHGMLNPSTSSSPGAGPKPKTQDPLADLIAAGVLKVPLRLFSQYKKQPFEATLLPTGEVEFQGQRYASPSAAGGAARATVTGRKMATNGWSFWQTQGDDGKPRTLADVRDAFPKQGN